MLRATGIERTQSLRSQDKFQAHHNEFAPKWPFFANRSAGGMKQELAIPSSARHEAAATPAPKRRIAARHPRASRF
jgi:hypothetical protein